MRIPTSLFALLLGGALAAGVHIGQAYPPTSATIRAATPAIRAGVVSHPPSWLPLTPAQVALVEWVSPGTDPAECWAHPWSDGNLWITCDDGAQVQVSGA